MIQRSFPPLPGASAPRSPGSPPSRGGSFRGSPENRPRESSPPAYTWLRSGSWKLNWYNFRYTLLPLFCGSRADLAPIWAGSPSL
eukprot:976026-Pyramimonas_sp.AAC.1